MPSQHRSRACDCLHSYPVCACTEGIAGPLLLKRSNWLSSLAGWPGPVDPAEAARIVLEHGRPGPLELVRLHGWPTWLALPRVVPAAGQATSGCGCGRA